MRHYDWNQIEAREGGEFDTPKAGAYIAVITQVEDVEKKEYVKIGWDFAEGEYKGDNTDTYDRAGFWPGTIYRSYKEKALGFFKAFISAVEGSNPGYAFDDQNLQALVGKKLGVVLGEEGYIKSNGLHGVRFYVAQTKTLQDIKLGNFKIPEDREKSEEPSKQSASGAAKKAAAFDPIVYTDNDEDLPF